MVEVEVEVEVVVVVVVVVEAENEVLFLLSPTSSPSLSIETGKPSSNLRKKAL